MTIIDRIDTKENIGTIEPIRRKDLNRENLRELIDEIKGSTIVSIYLDTYTYGEKQLLNGPQLERIIPHIEEELKQQAKTQEEIELYTEQLLNLAHNEKFWQTTQEGLAIFTTEKHTTTFDLYKNVDMSWTVSKTPRLDPLSQDMKIVEKFLILSVSQEEVRLLEATDKTFKQLPLKNIPRKMSDVIPEDNYEKNSPSHIGNGNSGFSVSFGHDKSEIANQQIDRYLKTIAENLKTALPLNDQRPIVIMATPNYMSAFREHHALQHIEKAFIHGSYAKTNNTTLYETALPVFQEELNGIDQKMHDMIDKAESQKLIERSTDAIYEIVQYEIGRIETLILHPLPTNGSPRNKQEPTKIDEIVQAVIKGNGDIITYDTGVKFPLTAILRY